MKILGSNTSSIADIIPVFGWIKKKILKNKFTPW